MKRLLLALLLFGIGCRRDPPPPIAHEPPPEIPALPAFPIAFEKEIDPRAYPAAEAPAATPRWDFNEKARHNYVVEQELINYSTTADKFGKTEMRSRTRGDGILEFLGGATRLARAYYKLSTREYWMNNEPVPAEHLNKQPPAKVEYVVAEDGTVKETKLLSGGDTQVLEFLVPLPGERTIDAVGDYRQKGTIRAKVTGYVRVERWLCARIEAEFEIDLAPALEDGSGSGRMKGHTVGYFAVEAGHYVSARAAISMAWNARVKYSKAGEPDKWNVGTMELHTLLTARLR